MFFQFSLPYLPIRTQLKLETLEGASLFENDDDTLSDKHGCPAYVSPEILFTNAYSGTMADCWSVGVILYTMLVGRYPFHDTSPSVVFTKIRRGTYNIPDSLTKHAKCLIRSLIRIDPEQRLTAEDALAHRWLRSQFSMWPRPSLSNNSFSVTSNTTGNISNSSFISNANSNSSNSSSINNSNLSSLSSAAAAAAASTAVNQYHYHHSHLQANSYLTNTYANEMDHPDAMPSPSIISRSYQGFGSSNTNWRRSANSSNPTRILAMLNRNRLPHHYHHHQPPEISNLFAQTNNSNGNLCCHNMTGNEDQVVPDLIRNDNNDNTEMSD